jgi:cbb3-type cytochrome oxidase subunit 3
MIIIAGAIVLLGSLVYRTSNVFIVLSFLSSFGVLVLGIVDVSWGMWSERVQFLKAEALKLKNDKRGIITIWIVCLLSLCVYSILWWTLGWVTFNVIDVMTASFSYPPQATLTITLMKAVLTWHPILFFFGMLLWAYNLSQKTEEVTTPIGMY